MEKCPLPTPIYNLKDYKCKYSQAKDLLWCPFQSDSNQTKAVAKTVPFPTNCEQLKSLCGRLSYCDNKSNSLQTPNLTEIELTKQLIDKNNFRRLIEKNYDFAQIEINESMSLNIYDYHTNKSYSHNITMSLLDYAIQKGKEHIPILKHFLSVSSINNPAKSNHHKWTALHTSAYFGCIECYQTILDCFIVTEVSTTFFKIDC